jgi:hypothetical protein
LTESDRLLRTGLILAVVASIGQTLGHVVNLFALHDRYYHLDVSSEGTAFSWASTAATFAAACGALLLAARPETHRRSLMVVLGASLAYVSLDDFIELHERSGDWVADRIGAPEFVGPRLWVFLFLPILAAAARLLAWTASQAPARPPRYLLAGMGLLVAAVVSEALGILTKLVEEHGIESPHRLRAGLEEGLELAGWVLIAAALIAMLYTPSVIAARTAGPEVHGFDQG